MPTEKIQFAKIVASPTDDSWSQIYSAGNLYAVVSLTKKSPDEDATLNVIGKGIINNIEAEFFGLEAKNLESIKNALESAIESTPDKVHLNLILIFVKDAVAYVFLIGHGEIMIQREGKKGVILSNPREKKSEDLRTVIAGSGPLKDNDLLLLKTREFSEIVSKEALDNALKAESADEAAEILTPLVHGKEKGSASAAFLTYLNQDEGSSVQNEENEEVNSEKSTEESNIQIPNTFPENQEASNLSLNDTPTSDLTPHTSDTPASNEPDAKDFFTQHDETPRVTKEKKPFTLPQLPFSLPRVKRAYLGITGAILLILILSILFTNYQKENAQAKAEFEKIYSDAEKEVEEGESLEELNANVAEDNFKRAQKILEDNKNKFKNGTNEREQIDELLARVSKKASSEDTGVSVEAKAVDTDKSPLLALLLDKKAKLATQNDEGDLFYLTGSKIAKVPTTGEEEDIFDNDDDWTSPVGLGAFGSNVYVLDKKEGLLKFVAGTNGYGKSSYFASGTNPNLTKSAGMAIDASVYILYADGKVEKYTRGKKDSFSLSGTKKPLKSPTKIYTGAEIDNIYILDNGNSRIVVYDKNGNFKKDLTSTVLNKATNLVAIEKDSKIYVLSKGKVYELPL